MNNPAISVILPVYNGTATLYSAINSVLEQTFTDYEIIILDDGSNDNSLEVISIFNDPRISVIFDGANKGLAYRLNQGIDLARGRYIARMDQDDLCFPERFDRQFTFLESHPEVDLLGCRTIVFRGICDIVGLMSFHGTSHDDICAKPWDSIHLAHPTWMGRKGWFLKYRYRIPEIYLAEDQELLLRSYPESIFACLDEVLLAYRRTHFLFYKTMLQRSSLLKMQLHRFAYRREWFNTTRAVLLIFAKMLVDCIAALPGCEDLFFKRMAKPVPQSVLDKFHKLKFENESSIIKIK